MSFCFPTSHAINVRSFIRCRVWCWKSIPSVPLVFRLFSGSNSGSGTRDKQYRPRFVFFASDVRSSDIVRFNETLSPRCIL